MLYIPIKEADMQKINKDSPLPLYYQLKENILKAVKNNEFKTGERLPSERELAEFNGVSRMTVKKAVDILVDNNYLYRKQGSGTFVSDYKDSYSISPLLSFSREMEEKGLNYSSKILNFKKIKNKEIAKKMNINPEKYLINIERLRLIENKAFLLENTYLQADRFRELEIEHLKNNSLYKIFKEKYKLNLTDAEAEIEAVIFDSNIADKMNIEEGMLGLYFEQYSKNKEGQIIEYTSAYYRNDSYKFKFTFELD